MLGLPATGRWRRNGYTYRREQHSTGHLDGKHPTPSLAPAVPGQIGHWDSI